VKELSAALVVAQSEMPAVDKNATNPHFRNKFASLDNIIDKTRPVLNKHGLSIQQFPSISDLGAPTLVTRITHVSGDSIEYAAPLFLQGQDMQKYGAALTYARRYAWAAALGIANDEDDDGNHASRSSRSVYDDGVQRDPGNPQDGSRRPENLISEAQRKRLYAMSKEANISDDELKALVLEVAGVEHSKDIPKAKYEQLCEAVQAVGLPF